MENVGVTGLGSDFTLGVLLAVTDGPVGLVGEVGDVTLAACSFSIAIKALAEAALEAATVLEREGAGSTALSNVILDDRTSTPSVASGSFVSIVDLS